MSSQSMIPFSGEIIEQFRSQTDAQLEKTINAAAACFEIWRNTGFAQRTRITAKAATLLHENIEEFAWLLTLEMGKLKAQAKSEVKLSADILDHYAQNSDDFLVPQSLKPSSGGAVIISDPMRVRFGVQPWNFPYYQLARFAAPNIMAGNVVMVKHSASVPQCAIAFEKLWKDAGAPNGLYTNLPISYDQVNQLIDDPRIKGLALTGSNDAGKTVAANAGQVSGNQRCNLAVAMRLS